MDSWMLFKEEGAKNFKVKDYQKACDCYKEALTEIESKFDGNNHELKVEAAKITSNISLMYYKASKEQNDESLLLESKIYAKKAISYNPKWIKGYLRLFDVCKLSKDLDDILQAITNYLQVHKDAILNDDFKSLLKEVKYYTHKSIMMLSPSWHLVKFKDNVVVVDHSGAGHFKDFKDFLECYGTSVQRISVLVRAGVYIGSYELTNAIIDIVGDCNIGIDPKTKAIDKDPIVIFTSRSTFLFKDSKVSLQRISVFNEIAGHQPITCKYTDIELITCKNTDIKLMECCFVSKYSVGLFCSESSKLNCKSCRSVGGFDGITIESKSRAKLTDCFISEMAGAGIQARNEAERIILKHCTVTKCAKQGFIVCTGAKIGKVVDSSFKGNCSRFGATAGSIHLQGCRVLVKNTFIQSQNSFGVYIQGGKGIFDNVVIENCAAGIIVVASIEIKNCLIDNCFSVGIHVHNFEKGTVELENNSIKNCLREITRTEDSPMPIFKGEKTYSIEMLSLDKETDWYKEVRKSIKNDDPSGCNEKVCDHCGFHEIYLQSLSKTLKLCGECKMVFYCSSDCQRKAWKLHRPHCKVYVKLKLGAS